jgi:hypothetical protein
MEATKQRTFRCTVCAVEKNYEGYKLNASLCEASNNRTGLLTTDLPCDGLMLEPGDTIAVTVRRVTDWTPEKRIGGVGQGVGVGSGAVLIVG